MKNLLLIFLTVFIFSDVVCYLMSDHKPLAHWYYLIPGSGFVLLSEHGVKRSEGVERKAE